MIVTYVTYVRTLDLLGLMSVLISLADRGYEARSDT